MTFSSIRQTARNIARNAIESANDLLSRGLGWIASKAANMPILAKIILTVLAVCNPPAIVFITIAFMALYAYAIISVIIIQVVWFIIDKDSLTVDKPNKPFDAQKHYNELEATYCTHFNDNVRYCVSQVYGYTVEERRAMLDYANTVTTIATLKDDLRRSVSMIYW